MNRKESLKLHVVKYDQKSELLLQKIYKAERSLKKTGRRNHQEPERLTFFNIRELIPEFSKDEIEASIEILKEMEYISIKDGKISITKKGRKSLNGNLSIIAIWLSITLILSIAAIVFFLYGSDLLYSIL